MINIQKLVKVTMAWISIVYVVCYVGVLLFAPIRPGFMMYALHSRAEGLVFENVFTFGTFISGLIIWNVIALLVAGLFAWLWNVTK